MGPYSEEMQFKRADAIVSLLQRSPNLPDTTKAMWQNHLANLSRNETTYNYRVKEIYSKLKRDGVVTWGE
tara:strand:- start:1318 stop:1527 length:210 start_codon:yes stop_codon:yes gene_type:complete